jgi:orotate phosphoribosyltransferase
MNVYRPQAYQSDWWIQAMKKRNGYWLHDGNPNRPYALLTSGMVSNFYANCSVITKDPKLLAAAAADLLRLFAAVTPRPHAYCGSAYGAITLAYELAKQTETEAWFTAKGQGDEMKLDRFEFGNGVTNVVMVEDVITTFKTTRNSIEALRDKAKSTGAHVLPYVFALVNRLDPFVREIDGFRIIALIEEPGAKNWREGENPFTSDGQELVYQVRPKQNWAMLIKDYQPAT